MERVWSLYQSKTAKIERTKQEMAALINIPKTQLYVTETHGVVDSYIAINKGADFTHYIHEWAGEIEVVKKSILDCQNRFFSNTPLTLIAPLENESSKFLDISEQNWKGSLGLVKILNHQALLACMDSFCKKSSIPLHLEQQKPLSEEELLLLALGRDGITSPTCLPLFLWGFDSI